MKYMESDLYEITYGEEIPIHKLTKLHKKKIYQLYM